MMEILTKVITLAMLWTGIFFSLTADDPKCKAWMIAVVLIVIADYIVLLLKNGV